MCGIGMCYVEFGWGGGSEDMHCLGICVLWRDVVCTYCMSGHGCSCWL